MILGHLNKAVNITRVGNSAVAATSDVETDILDMQGFDSVMFVAALGDVTSGSVLELEVQQNSANSSSGMAEIATTGQNTAGASDFDKKLLIGDVVRPKGRYVRAVLKRGTQNAVVDGIFAIQYGARDLPITQGSTVADIAEAISPTE